MVKRGRLKSKGTIAYKGSVSYSVYKPKPMTKEEAEALVKQLYSWRKERDKNAN